MNALKILGIPAVLATAFLSSTVAAAQPSIEVEGAAPRAEVSFADLDLGRPAGVAALQSRVRAAARDLCLGYAGGDLEERMARQTCFATALASARPQVEQAVAEFGRTQLAGRRTITVAVR